MHGAARRMAGIVGLVLALASTGLVVGLAPAAGSTLYVDRANPACTNTGSGSEAQPFCTISAAAAKVAAGQTVQVAAGTYNEAVTVRTSGTSTAPVVFTAAPGALVTVSGSANGFVLSSRSWVTVNGFAVTKTTGWGIDVSSSSHVTISGNHVTLAGQPVSGKVKGGIRLTGTTDSTVSGNTSDHNSDYGILLTDSSTRDVVSGNTTFNNAEGYQRAAAGIRQYRSPGNTVAGNVSHDNEDSGIESYTGSNNALIYDNVTYHNGDHGIDNYQSTGQRIFANSVYNNVTAGINVEGSSTGATLANNISVDNGINSPRTHSNIRIESGSTSGTTMDYDLVDLTSASDALLIWSSSSYTSLSSFQKASKQETHGIDAAPRWSNPGAGDFHLLAGSPAIDSATSAPAGQPSTDVEGNARVDDPAVPDTGAGTPTYADRGAYERGTGDAPPSAALSVSPASGKVNLSVSADASASTDTDATPIASYAFDFGDGSAVVGPQPGATASHSYTRAGTYTVTVTVRDTAGLASTATRTVTVTDDPPAAALSAAQVAGGPLRVSADASGSTDTDDTPIATYRFDFGDGSNAVGPQAGASAVHDYTSPGTYTIAVTVTDTAGNTGRTTTSITVTVDDRAPAAALSVTPGSGDAPLRVTADASASTDDGDGFPIASYRFDFGDGTAAVGPQAGATAPHTYAQAGDYTVTVTVTDTAGLSSKATSGVHVTAPAGDGPPAAALTLSPDAGNAPLDVTADASGSTDDDGTPIATYAFDFGDGTKTGPQSGATASHRYPAAGLYTVKVTVTDTIGQSSTTSAPLVVRAPDAPPAAALKVTPSSGSPPLAVTADASASTDGDATPIASYSFDFGDGSAPVGPQSGATAPHTYSVAGTYTVRVTVTDTGGLTGTATAQVVASSQVNLIGNPGFETSLTGWDAPSSEPTTRAARVAGGHSGSWSAQSSNAGTSNATCTLNDSPNWVKTTSAGTYTGTLWVRADVPGATLKLRFREYSSSGSLLGTQTTLATLTTTWSQVGVSIRTASPGSTLDFNAYVSSAAPGTCFYADDAAIVLGS